MSHSRSWVFVFCIPKSQVLIIQQNHFFTILLYHTVLVPYVHHDQFQINDDHFFFSSLFCQNIFFKLAVGPVFLRFKK